MNLDESQTVATVAELRRTFDQTFAEAPQTDAALHDDLLAIRIGNDPYAVPLREIAGLFADRRVTWLPGSVAELCGLVGLRGAILPVYDLGALFGYPRGAAPRWLLVLAHTAVALAFERFDGHLRVPRGAIFTVPERSVAAGSLHVHDVVRTETFMRPVIHVPSVLEAIAVLVGQCARSKE
jgi:purine-binding chemotaxis protein CheW